MHHLDPVLIHYGVPAFTVGAPWLLHQLNVVRGYGDAVLITMPREPQLGGAEDIKGRMAKAASVQRKNAPECSQM